MCFQPEITVQALRRKSHICTFCVVANGSAQARRQDPRLALRWRRSLGVGRCAKQYREDSEGGDGLE